MGQTMGTGNVADDDAETLVYADESEYDDGPDHSPDACRVLGGRRCPACQVMFGYICPPGCPIHSPR